MHDTGMDTADFTRLIENLLRLGTITEVDHAARKIRVQSGNLKTDWLDWPADIGRNYKRWRPLRVGTQVVLGCIGGDPAQAQILQILYTDSINSPSTDPDIDIIQFDDGTALQYNSSSKQLLIDCKGPVLVKSPNNITLDTPQTNVKGKLDVEGLLTYKSGMNGSGGTGATATITGDVTITAGDLEADGISLKTHKTSGVQQGE